MKVRLPPVPALSVGVESLGAVRAFGLSDDAVGTFCLRFVDFVLPGDERG